ncbi:MAG: hypothetical protein IJ438_06955 [Clostridia bacterium]|nr:hypothetical protein [Clostridia bacterium]
MKGLIFLPDREGREELLDTTGFVRVGADAGALGDLAARMTVPAREAQSDQTAQWRGALAFALLCDCWADAGVTLTVLEVDASTSLFAAWVLSARAEAERRDQVRLILLEKDGQRRLLGMADRHTGLALPAAPSDLTDMIPARAAWFDREAGVFADPIAHLNERDRAILLSRVHLMGLDSAQAAAFTAAIAQADKAVAEPIRHREDEALAELSIRMQAVHGMADFAAFSALEERYCDKRENALLRCFTAQDTKLDEGLDASFTYAWNGVPFARTSSTVGLTGTSQPGEEEAMAAISGELAIMVENSTRFNRDTARALQSWLDAHGKSRILLSASREQIDATRALAQEHGMQPQLTVTLHWPWDASSGAVRALLREALGARWMAAAAQPFSDRLTKLTGFVMGDTALNICCACSDGVLLPPLSQAMAACVADSPDGEGLALDAMRFVPTEDGSITASFLLRGAGEVCMVRTYAPEELLVLTAEESPRLAVWPCLPLPEWHAYHVFARPGAVRAEALTGGKWQAVPEREGAWSCLKTETYPACLTIMQDDLCLGAMPNHLPPMSLEQNRDAVAAIDLGASATVAVLSFAGKAEEAPGQPLTRMLLSPHDDQIDPFLMSLIPATITPTAVELNGSGDELFTDGSVCRTLDFDSLTGKDASTLVTSLKWRADSRGVRARRILLQQVMLETSLRAVLAGAKSIAWRITVADEMAEAGRTALITMMEELACATALSTGLPLTEGVPAVTWAVEAAALCAYLRGEGGLRGSFAVLDLGGGSMKTHLWMHGMNRPSAGALVLEGTQTLLLSALRERPELLQEDFADCPDAALNAAVAALCDQLRRTGASLHQTDKALLMLDALLDEHKQAVTAHLVSRLTQGRPAYMQSILLEALAAALFTAGLMLEQSGSDSLMNHRLPDELSLCLTGRGSWVMTTLTMPMQANLEWLARVAMRQDHPVRHISLTPEKLPALGVALGLTALRDTGNALLTPAIRTKESFSEMMLRFMQALCAGFPYHTWLLHPGLMDMYGNLTVEGVDTVRREASVAYGDGEDIPESVMRFVTRMRTAALTADRVVSPGE